MSTTAVPSLASSARGHLHVRLREGACVALRPLDLGEVEPLLAVFDGLSRKSRASRYLVGMPRLPSSMVAALVDVDGHDHVAWLASVAGQPVGLARYVRLSRETVEVAFEVVDAWQGQGLGAVLLDVITTVAAARGVRRLRATVHPANTPSLRLLARIGMRLVADDGLLEGESPLRLLDPPLVDRRAVVALAGRRTSRSGDQNRSASCRSPC
jgi:RimJ/RimL family protein N-acetyltransferase